MMKNAFWLLLLVTLTLLSATTVLGSEAVQTESVSESEEVVDLDNPATDDELPVQSGPLIDLFGPTLLSLEMTSESTAQLREHLTSEVLQGKKVIGVYFSADCGPCRQFTPELVQFYEKMNNRRGKKGEFEIVWVSRCRDMDSYGQYFTQMPWIALPPQEAMGARGEQLSQMFGVKGIPSLVLLDEVGGVITKDARNQIPKDKAGIGFPWRNPMATLYMTLVPRSLRFMIKRELSTLKEKTVGRVKSIMGGAGKKGISTTQY